MCGWEPAETPAGAAGEGARARLPPNPGALGTCPTHFLFTYTFVTQKGYVLNLSRKLPFPHPYEAHNSCFPGVGGGGSQPTLSLKTIS